MSREEVWRQVAEKYPNFFLPEFDRFDSHEAIREIILGGSPAWAGVHERFKPFPEANVLDMGSNVGVYSLFCATHGAHVKAIDPHPIFTADLAAIMNEYHLPIDVVQAAVGASPGYQLFRVHAKNGSLQTDGVIWSPADAQGSIKAQILSLEQALEDKEWDMVKVDVEGSEFEIFSNANPQTLRQIKFMFIEFHPWACDRVYERVIDLLKDCFKFEGTFMNDKGRWDAAYCTRRS